MKSSQEELKPPRPIYDNSWCKWAGNCPSEDADHYRCKDCANPIPFEEQQYTELNEELSQWDNMQIGWSHQVDRGLIHDRWRQKAVWDGDE